MATGGDLNELTTGSEVEPGVYYEDGQWLAWDYDPSGDIVTVYAGDLTK